MSEPRLAVGDYVTHPIKPEWGLGRVLDVAGHTLTVYFRDLPGEHPRDALRKLRVDKVALERRSVASDIVLDNLPPYRAGDFVRPPRERLTYQQGIEKFQALFPLFFEDPRYIGDLKAGERAYKWAAHELFQQTLGGGTLGALLQAREIDAARTRVLAVEGRVNLLSRFEKAALREALRDDAVAEDYLLALDALISDGVAKREGFERYIAAVERLPSVEGRTDPAKWPVATLIPYLAEPSTFAFLKPQVTQECAARLMFDLNYAPALSWLTYSKLHEMSVYLLGQLRRYGARDFIDVQSFIYVIGGGSADA